MRATDELNSISTFDEEEYFKEYFEPMDIPEEAKEEREEASEDIFDLLLFMFLLIEENLNNGAFTYNDLLMEFQRRYADIIATYGRNDSYFQSYLGLVPGEILDTTIKNLDNEYYTSRERAARIAVNEANTILNYEDLQKAIEEGMNVKIWHTQRDNQVRDSHRKLEGKKIGITEYFEVGQSRLLFPCDEVNCTNIRDIAGCRCYAKTDYDPDFNKKVRFRIEEGFKDSGNEENIGRWIYNTFGGDITLLPENNPEGEYNPDYLWNGKLWDLKTPTSSRVSTVRKRFKHGLEQIYKNPGGLVFDLSDSELTYKDIMKMVNEANPDLLIKGTEFIVKKGDSFKRWTH